MARTTHRSSAGKKLYAVRGKKGEFEDIQTYKRAHGSDVQRDSEPERMADRKAAKKKAPVRKAAVKKPATKKAARKR